MMMTEEPLGNRSDDDLEYIKRKLKLDDCFRLIEDCSKILTIIVDHSQVCLRSCNVEEYILVRNCTL